MTKAKSIYVFGVILYTGIAMMIAPILKVHWIHLFNSLMISSIFYNLLDFKFSCIEDSEEEQS